MRPSSVDVVRHWQDLGYLIIYVTGRPCMQLQKVLAASTSDIMMRMIVIE